MPSSLDAAQFSRVDQRLRCLGVLDWGGTAMFQLVVGALLAAFVVACSPDPNEQANKQFVEAQLLLAKAEKQESEERLWTLQNADQKLKSIIVAYPASHLAVQLVSGQGVGDVSLRAVAEMIQRAAWPVCLRQPKRACVLDKALQLARTIKPATPRAGALAIIASALAKEGKSSEAAAVFKEALELIQLVGADHERDGLLDLIFQVSDTTRFPFPPIFATIAEVAGAATIARALVLAQSIKNEGLRARTLNVVAVAQAKAGLMTDATRTFKQALELARNDDTLVEVVKAQAKAGYIAEARHTAQSISTGMGQLQSASALAEAEARARPDQSIRSAFATIVYAAQSIEAEGIRDIAFEVVAKAQARSGQLGDALDTARAIKGDVQQECRAVKNSLRPGHYADPATQISDHRLAAAKKKFPHHHLGIVSSLRSIVNECVVADSARQAGTTHSAKLQEFLPAHHD